ncbi:hypothetical protein GPAL_3387 [Glaciecola pallidula DSM 14239 = ACAM 615]|uniref:Uncharacterized protein n=1 Tax=Brumicola pallidula DSM 14239 = ACAM 615 TaxID=1121922 RepID=K7A424_9ALTE|nr:hypothetical protein GPAL_3387 [Glaciecola pallidula DSM 14239 = ACAM 615]
MAVTRRQQLNLASDSILLATTSNFSSQFPSLDGFIFYTPQFS